MIKTHRRQSFAFSVSWQRTFPAPILARLDLVRCIKFDARQKLPNCRLAFHLPPYTAYSTSSLVITLYPFPVPVLFFLFKFICNYKLVGEKVCVCTKNGFAVAWVSPFATFGRACMCVRLRLCARCEQRARGNVHSATAISRKCLCSISRPWEWVGDTND